ncbi:putative quinol monooxygenase [Companilactobacillus bobalius]|uniref:ABM domain-containing protein n=2 Tax=Companilactobacillus bobalius TaxID=2801451 RepID=A0A202FES0_9LACO|nr:antibiotic biosynthesis monooxygenase [Companilactobacillus bobalius]KAE9560584.1 hypothetical protein ATN92_10610 [Companilactobacillus bobalius]KRK83359.1 hypothetical protein FC78_GL002170 [Companilactobacillus bobalius DSM 19674]OVE98947.1 hypothetical protein LKACC16343_00059 [Companilactobacillus bobalius]GEO56923.1 antibiotic biosynthesis monooxygenase [Companilactobacillus paralimentarius]
MKLLKKPIFSLYKLTIDPKNRQDFLAEGMNNLITSHRNEAGTLMMCATHEDEAGSVNYIFEMYQDEASYQIHAASPQFQRYAKFAQKVVQSKKIHKLNLETLHANDQVLEIKDENPYFARLLEITTDYSKLEVLKSISQNTIASFVSNIDSDHWVIIDIFQNKSTMEKVNISQQLSKISAEYSIHELNIDTMVSQDDLKLE